MQTGIWIDTKKALVIHLTGQEPRILSIESNIEGRTRTEGQTKQVGRFGDQYLSLEKSKQNRQRKQLKKFFEGVAKQLSKSRHVVVFGPSMTKYELEKYLSKDKSSVGKVIGVEVADSMTDNQIIAWVKGYYAK